MARWAFNSFPIIDGSFRQSMFSLLYGGGVILPIFWKSAESPDQNAGEAETSDKGIALITLSWNIKWHTNQHLKLPKDTRCRPRTSCKTVRLWGCFDHRSETNLDIDILRFLFTCCFFYERKEETSTLIMHWVWSDCPWAGIHYRKKKKSVQSFAKK